MINHFKTFPFCLMVIFGISPVLMGFSTVSISQHSHKLNSQQISLQFPSGTDRGAPLTTGGGGTRGTGSNCLNTKEGELSLNSLTPNYSNVATTASATPTFYYYLPANSASLGEFVIVDLNQNPIYQTTFKLPAQSGIMKIKAVPKIPLSPDQYYQWSLKIICDSKHRDKDIVLEGNLEYQKINEAALPSSNLLEKAKFYAKQGIWLEALDSAAQVRSTSPADWTELLQSVNLKEMISQPFVECCQSSNNANNSTFSSLIDSSEKPF